MPKFEYKKIIASLQKENDELKETEKELRLIIESIGKERNYFRQEFEKYSENKKLMEMVNQLIQWDKRHPYEVIELAKRDLAYIINLAKEISK